MKRYAFATLAAIGLGLGVLLSSPSITTVDAPEPIDTASSAVSTETYGDLPLYFEENNGQTNAQVRYFARTGGYSVFFTDSRMAFNLVLDAPAPRREAGRPDFDLELREEIESATPMRTYGLYLDFVGANPSPALSGESLQDGITSYFHGSPDQWVAAVPHFSKVRYTELYPGIDAVFYGSAQQVQYDFIVAPRADPSQIQLQFDPVESIGLTDNGDLRLSLGDRVLTMNAPYTYQTIDGVEHEVESRFVVNDGLVTFDVGEYDASLPLVIDPVIVYAGYIGGSGDDGSDGTYLDDTHYVDIAVDEAYNVYITSTSMSTDATFPTAGGPDLTANGGWDVVVVKLGPEGAIRYAGYIGGSGVDRGASIVVDASGSAYIAGYTSSSETTFPVVSGPDLTYNGDGDAFVAKVSPAGTALVFAGYIGGSAWDSGGAIAVDAAGATYITGFSYSTESTFPVIVGPDLTFNGTWDAFVAKISPSGTSLVYAGYVGGTQREYGTGIAVDSSGNAYITGITHIVGTSTDFPLLVGPYLTYFGNNTAFVTKVNASGTALVYSGFIASGDGFDIELDKNNNAIVVGTADYIPAAGNPDSTFNGGILDAFVMKVNSAGTGLVYAGYLGGGAIDRAWAVDVDQSGNAYVAGVTSSSQSSFPVLGGPDSSFNGGTDDAFLARVSPNGTLLSSGYIGGTGAERIHGVAVDRLGNVYVAGLTNSSEASFPVKDGPGTTHNGGYDIFVAKLSYVTGPNLISNPGFEVSDVSQLSKAQDWKGSSLSQDSLKCNKVDPPKNYSHSGECAFRFKGSVGEKAKITQTVTPDTSQLQPGTALVLSAWIDSTANTLLGKLVVYYTDGTKQAFAVLLGPSAGYSRVEAAPFFLGKTASKYKISFQNKSTSGKLYLDDIELIPYPAGTRMLLPVPEPDSAASGWRSP